MSRFYPHSPYAEDQTLHHTILTTHVLHRGFESGAAGGILLSSIRSIYLLRRSTTPARALFPALRASLLRSTGVGAVLGMGVSAVGLGARMYGREGIEWKDRSWRLLENKGQVEVDDWSLGGIVVGLMAVVVGRGEGQVLGWRRVVGGAGVGGWVGVMGYMGWRYGVRGGKFDDL